MASSAVLDNSRLPANVQVRVRAGAVLKVAIVLVGLSLALTACREHAAVARVDIVTGRSRDSGSRRLHGRVHGFWRCGGRRDARNDRRFRGRW